MNDMPDQNLDPRPGMPPKVVPAVLVMPDLHDLPSTIEEGPAQIFNSAPVRRRVSGPCWMCDRENRRVAKRSLDAHSASTRVAAPLMECSFTSNRLLTTFFLEQVISQHPKNENSFRSEPGEYFIRFSEAVRFDVAPD
jgi:hypothetical protein